MKRQLRGLAGSLEGSDTVLLAAVMVLLALGAIVVYGAGSYNVQTARAPFGQHYILIKHLFMIGIGGLLMFGSGAHRLPLVPQPLAELVGGGCWR